MRELRRVQGRLIRADKTAAEAQKVWQRQQVDPGQKQQELSSTLLILSTLCQSDGHSAILRTCLGLFPQLYRTVLRCRLSKWDVTGHGCRTVLCIYAARVCSPVITPDSCSSYFKLKCQFFSWHKSRLLCAARLIYNRWRFGTVSFLWFQTMLLQSISSLFRST